MGATTSPTTGPLTPALAQRLSQNVNQHVIVIMRGQFGAAQAGTTAAARRAHAIVGAQVPLMTELREVRATHVKQFQLVNSFAATVSKGEEARLAANPGVAEVIPDVTIQGPALQPAAGSSTGSVKPHQARSTSLTPHVIPGACASNGQSQLDPEGLSLTGTDSDNPSQPTARSLGITGAGVKVAWIADGVDPNNINFIRADNKSVFVDYQDFTGDGPGRRRAATRRSSTRTRSRARGSTSTTSTASAPRPDPTACNIRIEGVAPGASLVGLDVFGERTRGHDRVQLPAGDQLRGRDRPRQRDQRVVRLEPVPGHHRARRHQAVRRRRRGRRASWSRLDRRRRATSTRSARRRPTRT